MKKLFGIVMQKAILDCLFCKNQNKVFFSWSIVIHRNFDDNRLLPRKYLNHSIPNKSERIALCINELREWMMCYMKLKRNVSYLLFQLIFFCSIDIMATEEYLNRKKSVLEKRRVNVSNLIPRKKVFRKVFIFVFC